MTFLELAKRRYSVRAFLDKEIEEEKLNYVLEAARYAPSACNLQPISFIVITDREKLDEIQQTYPREWFKSAPAVIVSLGDHSRSWKRRDSKDHCDVDVAIAVDHLTLAACDIGLGTCWVCAFDAKLCHQILKLPEHLEPVALIPIGYPAGDAPEKKRRSAEDIILA